MRTLIADALTALAEKIKPSGTALEKYQEKCHRAISRSLDSALKERYPNGVNIKFKTDDIDFNDFTLPDPAAFKFNPDPSRDFLRDVAGVRRQASPPPDADAQPAGADASATAGTGGHPRVRTTSELLRHAEAELQVAYADSGVPAVVAVLMAELRDRAANLAAHND